MSLTSRLSKLAAENPATRLFAKIAPKGGLMHAAAALGGATLASQIAGVLLSPVYSRLYAPGDYGIFSVYSSIVATALTVGSLSYEQGIPVGKDDTEAVGLTVIAVLIVGLIGFAALAWLGLQSCFGLGGMGLQIGAYVWLVPVGIVAGGVYRALNYWALRRKAVVAIARTSVSQFVGSNTINLGFGIIHPNPLGLVLAGIAGSSAGMWGLARRTQLMHQVRAAGWQELSAGRLWTLVKKYRRLALIQAPSTLFNSLGLYLPGMLALPYFGADFAGQLFMALKVIALPAGLIGGSLSQVFYSGAAAVARERPQDLNRFFHRVFIRGAACSLLVLLIGLAAPWAIPFAFGAKWREAGEIVFWFSLYETVGLSVSALSSIPSVVGRLQGQLAINVARAVAVFLLFYLSHRFGLSGIALVKGYTGMMILNYVACYLLYKHQVRLVSRTGLTGWSSPTAAP